MKGYGTYYDNDYYVTTSADSDKDHINFERFWFDVISLLGVKLLKLTADQFEVVLRRAFHSITFWQEGKLRLLDLNLVNSEWNKTTLEQYMQEKVSSTLLLV